MEKNRLEAFSDGVIAILITILVLEMKAPHDDSWGALYSVAPIFGAYVLSFIYLGVYWNNHHHMLMTVRKVSGPILWGNLHLLFWLSLIPFTTGWMGENHFTSAPVATYGVILLMSALAYWMLQTLIIREQGSDSVLKIAVGSDLKGKSSPLLYLVAIAFSFSYPIVSCSIYVLAALIWFVPDKRVEKVLFD